MIHADPGLSQRMTWLAVDFDVNRQLGAGIDDFVVREYPELNAVQRRPKRWRSTHAGRSAVRIQRMCQDIQQLFLTSVRYSERFQ